MPYRHDDESEVRRAALALELAEVREGPRSDERTEREHAIERRLAALDLPRTVRRLPSLPQLPRLRVASPCSESWDAMVGNERARHCSKCGNDVFDLSAMTHDEVVALLRAHDALPSGGLPCVRFYRRKDGTIRTSDCLAGSTRRIAAGVAVAGTIAASIAMTLSLAPDSEASASSREPDRVVRLPHADDLEEEEIAFGMPSVVADDPYVMRTLLGGDGLDPAVYEPRIEPPEVRALHEIPPPRETR